MYEKTNSFLLCMDLQPYSHDCFSRNIKNFVWFPKQYSLGFFILEKFRTGVSCFSMTLFYSTLLALTDRLNYWQRVKYTRFAWAGGTSHALRGLEEPFFQMCCCVSLLFWREIGFGCTYYYVLTVPYSCGVVLVFLVMAGNSFWCYVRT